MQVFLIGKRKFPLEESHLHPFSPVALPSLWRVRSRNFSSLREGGTSKPSSSPPLPSPRIRPSAMTLGSSGAGSSVVGDQPTSLLFLLSPMNSGPGSRGLDPIGSCSVPRVRAAARSVGAWSDSSRSVEQWIRDDSLPGSGVGLTARLGCATRVALVSGWVGSRSHGRQVRGRSVAL
jgi:hypothetical protein